MPRRNKAGAAEDTKEFLVSYSGNAPQKGGNYPLRSFVVLLPCFGVPPKIAACCILLKTKKKESLI